MCGHHVTCAPPAGTRPGAGIHFPALISLAAGWGHLISRGEAGARVVRAPWVPAAQRRAGLVPPSLGCPPPARSPCLVHTVTQESRHPHPLGTDGHCRAAACWPQVFPVHALLTPRRSGQPPLISQSVSTEGGGGWACGAASRQGPTAPPHWGGGTPRLDQCRIGVQGSGSWGPETWSRSPCDRGQALSPRRPSVSQWHWMDK